MSRDQTSWLESPRRRLAAIPQEAWTKAGLTKADLLRAELVLFFMTRHYPDAAPHDAPMFVDGWRIAGDTDQTLIDPERHRLLLLLGRLSPAARLRALLAEYQRIAGDDDPTSAARRLCAWRYRDGGYRSNPYAEAAAARLEAYGAALTGPVPHRRWQERVAQPDVAFQFRRGGRLDRVVIPSSAIPANAPTIRPLVPVESRTREPIEISWTELADAAAVLDDARPDDRFGDRLADLRLSLVNEDGTREPVSSLTISGLVHTAGLMTAGKSTLLTLIAVVAAGRGQRVVLCTDTVSAVLNMVELLGSVGIDCAPVLGWSGRAGHSRALLERAGQRIASEIAAGRTVDFSRLAESASWLADTCLLEPFRDDGDATDQPALAAWEFPCHGLRPDGKPDAAPQFCPLRTVCPVHAAERSIPSTRVWVTTPAALLLSQPGPLASTVRMRWLEFIQHHADLVLVDEADRILGDWDHVFMPAQNLQDPEQGWPGVARPIDTAKTDEPARWHSSLRARDVIRSASRASGALNELLHRFYGSEGDRAVVADLAERVWNEQSLLWDIAQVLCGVEPREHADPAVVATARTLYLEQLTGFMQRSPTNQHPEPALSAVWDALQAEQPQEQVAALMGAWAAKVLESPPSDKTLRRATNLFALACWAWEFSENSRFVVDHSAGLIDEQFGVNLPDWGLAQARAIRSYLSLVPDMPMGNLVGFQWIEGTEPTDSSLRMLWCRGLGRWLLHHLHDLFASEGIDGPNVLLVSATGWSGRSSLFNLQHSPDLLLEVTPEAANRLSGTRFHFTPAFDGYGGSALRVSGAGADADRNLEAIVDTIFRVERGLRSAPACWADDVLRAIEDPERRRIMMVVNSTAQARLVAERISQVAGPRYRDNHVFVVPDSHGVEPGCLFERVMPRGRVETFGRLPGKTIVVVPLLSIERGLNILNEDYNGACGAVMFLTRPHPPASDPRLALSTLAALSLADYGGVVATAAEIPEARRELYATYRRRYSRSLAQPMQYSALDEDSRPAFVWNLIVRIWQTVGRGMRGGHPVNVYFADAAFAPGRAAGRADQPRSSVLAAMAAELDSVCGGHPANSWSARDRAVATAVFGILHRGLVEMSDERHYLL